MADGLLNKASIILTPTGYKAGTLYNVAPIDEPYEDFDFARASVASRVNSSGLVEMVGRTLGSELVQNGDFSELDVGWTVVDSDVNNYVQFTEGFARLKFLNTSPITKLETSTQILQANQTYKLVVDVHDVTSGQIKIDGSGIQEFFNTEGVTTRYITPTGNTPLRFYRNSANVDITFASVSVKEVIDTNNIPRISYDSNGDNGHILLEPTSTNLVPYSEDFSQWTNVSARLTPNQSSPDGSYNAYIVEDDNPSSYERVDETITTVASSHTFSVFIKKKTSAVSSYGGIQMGTGFSYVIFDSYNGTYNQQSNTNYDSIEVENFSSDWWRLKLTATLTTSTRVALWGAISHNGTSISPSATGSETYFGAQLEELSYATSYIPTLTGSQEVRATETATGAGSAELINSTEGVLYAEIAALVDDLSFRTISLSDGTTSNRCVLRYGGTTNRVNVLISSGGSIIFDNNFTLTEITDFSKIAVKWKVNDFALWVDGVERATDSSGAAPIGLSQLQLSNYNSSSNDFYGKCKALAVFNEALSDDELHNLTG